MVIKKSVTGFLICWSRMGLRDINVELSYAGKGDVILKEFLLPSISQSVFYDRITSFYTIDSLIAISQGLESLFQRKGKMRLIIGIHSFPREMVDASLKQGFLDAEISRIRQEISAGILSLSDSLQKEKLATLAWMIRDKLLEVKAASVRGEGIFHPKTLILKDSNNDRIVAVGSPNETGSGLGGNFEQIMVAKSWDSLQAVETQERFFSSLWNGDDEDVFVSEISEETADMILSSLGDRFRQRPGTRIAQGIPIIKNAVSMPSNFFVSGDIPSLFVHQERAVLDALSRWPVRVMFSDEVGLGKTFEVAATMVFLKKYCNVKKVLILTPKSVLLQWQDELKTSFNIDAWVFDSGKKAFFSHDGNSKGISDNNPLSGNGPEIILMSVQYARGRKNQGNVFNLPDTVFPDLLIVDEAHSARVSKELDGKKHKTITYSMLEEVSRKIPHLILATATPMQRDVEEYHAMLKLLGLPSSWNITRNYLASLRLIVDKEPDLTDASSAYDLLLDVVKTMNPCLDHLSDEEKTVISVLRETHFENKLEKGAFVQKNWGVLQKVFINLHPAHLLTIRNTRRSLAQIGYRFPKRNLFESPIANSIPIQDFYHRVNNYLETDGFSIEAVLNPDSNRNLGFVKSTYQQRIASSLHSCIKSLKNRNKKVEELKKWIERNQGRILNPNSSIRVNWEIDDWDLEDYSAEFSSSTDVNLSRDAFLKLKHSVENEYMSLSTLIRDAIAIKNDYGDMKIKESISLALSKLSSGDSVLLFSRYTDTVEALIQEFKENYSSAGYVFGVYTGKESYLNENGRIIECDKNQIKQALSSKYMRILFCSDAASEGLNLQAARVLINVDVPWTPARLEQRIGRIARLGQKADEVDVYNVWYPNSVESIMYHRIQDRLRDANLAIGEFPEVMADEIIQSILNGTPDDNSKLDELRDFRHTTQVKALESLWSPENKALTTSELIRQRLMKICDISFTGLSVDENGERTITLPDDSVIQLTEEAGCSDTISLKSKVWRFKDYSSDEIRLNKDAEGRVCSFVASCNQKLLKFESVFKLCLNEPLLDSDYMDSYPQMLPNNRDLNMMYAIDAQVSEPPRIWM